MEKRIRDLLLSRILTTQELSEYTGIPEITIKKRLERGKIDGVLKGRTYLFDRKDFVPAPSGARNEGQTEGQAPEGDEMPGGERTEPGGTQKPAGRERTSGKSNRQ